MNSCTFITLLCIGVIVLLIYSIRKVEHLGFPFNSLHKLPVVKQAPCYYQPYCTMEDGQPKPCEVPCVLGSDNPACNFVSPTPVFGVTSGAYSPSKWCPGPPLC